MSLPGLEHNVYVLVRVEPASYHEVAPPVGTDERGNQRRIQVAAKRDHMHAGAGHVTPGGDRDCRVVAIGDGGRRTDAPLVECGARENLPMAAVISAFVMHQLNTRRPSGQCDPAWIADRFSDHDVRPVFANAALSRQSRRPGRSHAEPRIEAPARSHAPYLTPDVGR